MGKGQQASWSTRPWVILIRLGAFKVSKAADRQNSTARGFDSISGLKWRLTALLAVIGLLLFTANAVYAKEEVREPVWKWCIWDCSYSGDYDTPQQVLDAQNAYIDDDYNQCVASVQSCGSCSKINNYSPFKPGGPVTFLNDIPNFQTTTKTVSTTFTAACQGSPASENSREINAGIAAYGKLLCPENDGWSASNKNHTQIIVDGAPRPAYDVECVRNIPDPGTCEANFGNPVDAIGNQKLETSIDYTDATGDLQLARRYSSAGGGRWHFPDLNQGVYDYSMPQEMVSNRFLGQISVIPEGIYYSGPRPPSVKQWANFRLINNDGLAATTIDFTDHLGNRIRYAETAPGQLLSQSPKKSRLTWALNSNGDRVYTATLPSSGIKVFDKSGRLISQVSPEGRSIDYQREPGRLRVVSHLSGRILDYHIDEVTGRITSVDLPDGRKISYQNSHSGQVEKVTFQDGAEINYFYSELGLVPNPQNTPTWLTGIVDESGGRLSTFTYDWFGPIRTERAGGAGRHDFYRSDFGIYASVTSGFSQVTLPDGVSQNTINWTLGPDGERRLVSQSQPAGSGCAASTTQIDYDAGGGRRSVDDYNGHRVCYLNDPTRGLEITRVEGLSGGSNCTSFDAVGAALPTGSRKISTQWHPVWQRPARVAEPLRLTTYVYNGQTDPFNGNALASCAPASAVLPDGSPIAVLCKQVEQSTLDANGAQGFGAQLDSSAPARSWIYSYNQWGQVLAATDPSGATTTSTYYTSTNGEHTKGDLQSVTDGTGKTTQFNRYDANGRVLSQTSAEGIVTLNTYDLRGRLLTQSIGGLLTTMTYLPTGLLNTLTQPSGYQLTYSYDAAHRLTGWSDNRSNSGQYVLDGAGNRTSEQTKNAVGQVAYEAHRSIDALNRVAGQTLGGAQTQSFQYDANGNLTAAADGANPATKYTYDHLGRSVTESTPLNANATLGYNALDVVTQASDFNSITTSYTRDIQGNATQEASPDIGTETNSFDPRGLATNTQDAAGRTQTITRDALGRPIGISYSSGTGGGSGSSSASTSFVYE